MGVPTEDHGQLWVANGAVCYRSASDCWAMRIDEIRLIGEMTNGMGLYGENGFLIFARHASWWYEAPFSAEGVRAALAAIEASLGPRRECMAFCTECASQVLWPPEMAGREVFIFRANWKKNLWAMLGSCFILGANEQRFAPEVYEFLSREP